MQRDHISLEEINLRMSRQFTDEQKQSMADFILINDEQKLLIPEVIALHEHFL
jgi:dephospho-CoA kinase